MKRPALPKQPQWDLGRDLDQPQDEFFGLIDEVEDPEQPLRFGKAQEVAAKITTALAPTQNLLSKLFLRKAHAQEDERELAELDKIKPTASMGMVASVDPDLEEHIIRLPSNKDVQEFLAAEREDSLFESIEKTRQAGLRSAAVGLWLAAIVFTWVGVQYGQVYILDLINAKDLNSPRFLVETFDPQVAEACVFVGAIMAPLLSFLLVAVGIGDLAQAISQRQVGRGVIGALGLLSGLAILITLASGFYLIGAALGLGGLLVVRLANALTRAWRQQT